jgi:hypothetical protein
MLSYFSLALYSLSLSHTHSTRAYDENNGILKRIKCFSLCCSLAAHSGNKLPENNFFFLLSVLFIVVVVHFLASVANM